MTTLDCIVLNFIFFNQKQYKMLRKAKQAFIFAGTISALTIASCGNAPEKKTAPEVTPGVVTKKAVDGEALYKSNCVACHQADGKGVAKTFPPLLNSDFLKQKEATIAQVIYGKTGELVVNGEKYNNTMPPQNLNDEEIAAVLTYVYTHFNDGGTVTEDEVKAIRAKGK